PMIGIEISPSGRTAVILVRSLFPHTVISNSSSGPSRKPVGASYAFGASTGPKQPVTDQMKHIRRVVTIIVVRWRMRIPVTGVCDRYLIASPRKDYHGLTRNDDSITGFELKVFRNSPSKHDFVIARRQSFNSRGAFGESKDDDLVSSCNRRKPSSNGNSL